MKKYLLLLSAVVLTYLIAWQDHIIKNPGVWWYVPTLFIEVLAVVWCLARALICYLDDE